MKNEKIIGVIVGIIGITLILFFGYLAIQNCINNPCSGLSLI